MTKSRGKAEPGTDGRSDDADEDYDPDRPTNEYVLNVAFVSFLAFTTLQLFFALMARSKAMMEDCSAMYIDVLTYFFNFLAERFKHAVHSSNMKPRTIRLYRLFLELIPPFISVTTLVAVTVLALQDAIETILDPPQAQEDQPDLTIMLVFSGLNLILDFVNVSCFARVDQAIGIGETRKLIESRSSREGGDIEVEATRDAEMATAAPTESTGLLGSSSGGAYGNGNSDDADDAQDEDTASRDTEIIQGLNLNMCSAWTHIAADTLRSIAVLLAAGFATLFPHLLTAADADSWGAIVVSIIILVSLAPLFKGLYLTACEIHHTWYHLDDQLHHLVHPDSVVVLNV